MLCPKKLAVALKSSPYSKYSTQMLFHSRPLKYSPHFKAYQLQQILSVTFIIPRLSAFMQSSSYNFVHIRHLYRSCSYLQCVLRVRININYSVMRVKVHRRSFCSPKKFVRAHRAQSKVKFFRNHSVIVLAFFLIESSCAHLITWFSTFRQFPLRHPLPFMYIRALSCHHTFGIASVYVLRSFFCRLHFTRARVHAYIPYNHRVHPHRCACRCCHSRAMRMACDYLPLPSWLQFLRWLT